MIQGASCGVGGGSKGSEPWSVDGFSKSGVDPSGFANTKLVSETNQTRSVLTPCAEWRPLAGVPAVVSPPVPCVQCA